MGKRGFEKISKEQFEKDFNNHENLNALYNQIKLPFRKTIGSAGYDFFAVTDYIIKKGQTIIMPTGIKAYMESDEWLAIYIRSSFGFKYNIRLMNQVGIIDSDYYDNKDNEGHIYIALENQGSMDKQIFKGESFAQGVFSKYLVAENDRATNIRDGGIGSTDRGNDDE